MRIAFAVILSVALSLTSERCRGQSRAVSLEKGKDVAGKTHPKKAKHAASSSLRLVPVDRIKVASEAAGVFYDPLKCDIDGNLYTRTDSDGVSGIRKLNTKGERVALFQASTAIPDLNGKIDFAADFSIAQNGEVYQLAFTSGEIDRHVFVYKPDGNYKSKIKLQPGFAWNPARVSAFSSGDLVTGLKYDREGKAMWPFTGIFSSDGTLMKEVTLKDDKGIRDMGVSADKRVTSPENPTSNRAVSWGATEGAADGNVYVMRRLSPAIFYAISPGGEVVRRFTLDPGRSDFMPMDMHIAGNRIAVLFYESKDTPEPVKEAVVKVIDLKGHVLATYEEAKENGNLTLGLSLACYSINPERFTFLTTTEDEKLEIDIAEPR